MTKNPKWRRSRTLSRRVEFRDISEDDLKFAWAAYKKGKLADMSPVFADISMDGQQFREAFSEFVTSAYDKGWTVLAETRRGFLPIGMVFGNVSPLANHIVVAGIVWFPTASPRNIIEGTVGFFQHMRKDAPMVLYATDEHKRVYEVAAAHGVMRRVGTSHIMIPGKPAAVFETRAQQ